MKSPLDNLADAFGEFKITLPPNVVFPSVITAPWFAEVAENYARSAALMSEAMFLTGKTTEEIRAMAACSPLSFEDFVRELKRG